MRQSSLSIHNVAAAVIDATISMSSRPQLRPQYRAGGRKQYQRRLSIYPQPDNQFVSGDSHIDSVRDTNSGFRHGNRSSNNYNHNRHDFVNNVRGIRPQSYAPRPRTPQPSFNQYQQVPPPPGLYANQQYYPPRASKQHFQPAPSRPRRSKPADYRGWEHGKIRPPPDSERFVVLSYNILADYLANTHRSKLYFHIPRHLMDWEWRKRSILFELGLWSPDIMCFQEVDRFNDLELELRNRGYSGIWKMRTGDAIDGCAIFWRTSRFKLMHEESIEFSKLGLRDNIAQLCVLECATLGNVANRPGCTMSPANHNRVVVGNIHVLYNPRRGEIKLGQVRVLLNRAQAVSKIWDDAPIVICGDFNSTPKSPLYNFISEQQLELSELDRDKVSGQASAEIRRPPRQNNYYPGVQTVGGTTATPDVKDLDMNTKSGDTLTDNNKQNDLERVSESIVQVAATAVDENISIMKNDVESVSDNLHLKDAMLQPTSDKTSLDALDKSSNVQDSHRSSSLSNDQITQACHDVASLSISETRSTACASARDSDESQRACTEATIEISSGQSTEETVSSNLAESNPEGKADMKVDKSYDINFDVNEKLEGLSLDEPGEGTDGDEALGEDLTPSPELLGYVGLENLSADNDSELADMEKPAYDPSAWTPVEVETATGNADCTLLEHSLKLRSTYAEVEDQSGTRDSNGEPLVTSYNRCFLGTVDYIWRSEGLQTVKVLAPIPKHAMQWTQGFPTKKWGSDHIALATELAITKNVINKDTEIQ